MKRWWRMIVAVVALELVIQSVVSQQQNDPPLNSGCSQYNATNTLEFFRNLNTTLADLRREITVNKTYFGTQQQARTTNPVYTMFQCRKYLSTADCVSCFDKAALDIRSICRLANGARVIYDGCFLRYESNGFYSTATALGNTGRCNNDTIRNSTAPNFNVAAGDVLNNLLIATPKIKGYYAATTEQVLGSITTVYAVAQCAETVSQLECQNCMNVAYENIKSCPPRSGARAIDAGCFMRYANTPFFANNQTINLKKYLKDGGSSNKKAIIGGIAGGVGLLLLLLALFLWYHLSRKKKVAQRGHILGSTELQGPVTYNYKELKSATKNFSEEYKLGEGGSGDVYKISYAIVRLSKEVPNTFIVSNNHIPSKSYWDLSVNRALQMISRNNSSLIKVVLARSSRVLTTPDIDPLIWLAYLQAEGENAYQFCLQPPDAPAFIGNTPEQLFHRDSLSICSEALAGTRARGDSEAVDLQIEFDLLSRSYYNSE